MSTLTHAKAPQSAREPESSLVSGPPGSGLSMQDLYGNSFIQSSMPQSSNDSAQSTWFDERPHTSELPQTVVEAPDKPGSQVGLVVRGKESPEHAPWASETHADVLLSNGMPVGFFGQWAEDGNTLQQNGFGMPGRVGTPDWWMDNDQDGTPGPDRAAYVDGQTAKDRGWASTVCTLDVSPEQAAAFDQYWEDLSKDPGSFSIVGDNCSTHAGEAFEAAGLIPGGIPGMDTPNALYEELRAQYGDALECESGYVDFAQRPDGSWTHEVLQ